MEEWFPSLKTMKSARPRRSQPPFKPSNWSINDLPGLSVEQIESLSLLGIHTTYQLLAQTQTANQRQALATQLQLHLQHVNKWHALARLALIPAVGCQYCGLLLHAGVSSIEQLANMPTGKVYQQILKLQVAMMQRKDLCPSASEVAVWIAQARSLLQRFAPG